MSRNWRVVAICTCLLAGATGAHAQGLAPLQAKLSDVYSKMLGRALPTIATGEATMLEASGRKDEAAKLLAAADKMKQGANQQPDEKLWKASITSVSDGANTASDTLSTKAGQLSDSAKKQFIVGLAQYVDGEVQLKGMKEDASQLAGLIGGATQGLSMMDAMRARGTINLAKTVSTGVPDIAAKSLTGLQAIKAFAASRSIQIPADLLQRM